MKQSIDQEFWTYEVTNTYPFHPGSIVSIYSIPMYIRADYHDNVWVKYEDRLICTPADEEIAKHICLEHNANVLNYHKNTGNIYDIIVHFNCMVGFLIAYFVRYKGYALSEITNIRNHKSTTYVDTNCQNWVPIDAISAIYPKIIGTDEFITDCAYPNCSKRCGRWGYCDMIEEGGA